jgi:uncharacterized protein
MDRDVLLKQVKETVLTIEPTAEVILYGSRARGDSNAESDWDFLVLVDGAVSDERVDRIRHRLYEIEWQFDQVISSIVRNREQWSSQQLSSTPFHSNVEREGIVL